MQPSSESVWGLLFLRLFAEASLRSLGRQLQESVLRSWSESSHGFAVHVLAIAGEGFGISLTIAIDGEDFFLDTTAHVGGA